MKISIANPVWLYGNWAIDKGNSILIIEYYELEIVNEITWTHFDFKLENLKSNHLHNIFFPVFKKT